jgi:predicted DNA-binding transcriptional regulator AlpA
MSSENTHTQPKLLDTIEVARLLGISAHQMYRMRAKGDGPPVVKIGGVYRYRPEAVEQWLRAQEQ